MRHDHKTPDTLGREILYYSRILASTRSEERKRRAHIAIALRVQALGRWKWRGYEPTGPVSDVAGGMRGDAGAPRAAPRHDVDRAGAPAVPATGSAADGVGVRSGRSGPACRAAVATRARPARGEG